MKWSQISAIALRSILISPILMVILGILAESNNAYWTALAQYAPAEMERAEADLLLYNGSVYYKRDQVQTAVETWQTARQLYQSMGNAQFEA
ncbi:MAG: hypothetical protein VKJ64_04815, partial [Leptolyngbyaceae bacterium]|nr:hypothetical protein [Leptolyngbyaceae bacterium]